MDRNQITHLKENSKNACKKHHEQETISELRSRLQVDTPVASIAMRGRQQ
jgi:hypothetical protein